MQAEAPSKGWLQGGSLFSFSFSFYEKSFLCNKSLRGCTASGCFFGQAQALLRGPWVCPGRDAPLSVPRHCGGRRNAHPSMQGSEPGSVGRIPLVRYPPSFAQANAPYNTPEGRSSRRAGGLFSAGVGQGTLWTSTQGGRMWLFFNPVKLPFRSAGRTTGGGVLGVPWPSPRAYVPGEPRQAAGCKNSCRAPGVKPLSPKPWWGRGEAGGVHAAGGTEAFWQERVILQRGTGRAHHLGFLMALSVQGPPQPKPLHRFGGTGTSPCLGSAASRFRHLAHGRDVFVQASSPDRLLAGQELGLLHQPLRRCQQRWGTGMGCCRDRLGTGCGRGFSTTAEVSWAVSAQLPHAWSKAGVLCHAGLSLFLGGYAASRTGS